MQWSAIADSSNEDPMTYQVTLTGSNGAVMASDLMERWQGKRTVS